MDGANENELFNLTGCLSACEKFAFNFESVDVGRATGSRARQPGSEVTLRFKFRDGNYEVKEQYVVYDENRRVLRICLLSPNRNINPKKFFSFIADVGGFLGLLLGHSLLSVYQTTAEAYVKVRGKAKAWSGI